MSRESIAVRWLLMLVGLFAAFAAAVCPAFADKRVALLIGNSGYGALRPLANPGHDVTLMQGMLEHAGFDEVRSAVDLGRVDFLKALNAFTILAHDSDIAVIYYSGHGMEMSGVNYLLPTDTGLDPDLDIPDQAVTLDRVLESVQGAKRLKLVILDACRDKPFGAASTTAGGPRSSSRGFRPPETPHSGTLIAFAAKAGSTASDGVGYNSPFAKALAARLAVPGRDVRLALGDVTDDVLAATDPKQEPFTYGSIGGQSIALSKTPVDEPPDKLAPISVDQSAQAIRNCDQLAASPYDPNRPLGVLGVDFDKLDADKAASLCQVALNSRPDDSRLAFQLGRALQRTGNSPELAEALRLYRKAAEDGYVPAMDNVGRMYREGDGVAKNEAEALGWFRKGADAGDPVALDDLGKMYAEARASLDRDYLAAKGFYDAAIAKNYAPARDDLRSLLTSVKNFIAASRNRDQLLKLAIDFPDLKVEVDSRIVEVDREELQIAAQKRIDALEDRAELEKIGIEFPALKREVDARIAQLEHDERQNAAQKHIAVSNDLAELGRIATEFPDLKSAADRRIAQLQYAESVNNARKRVVSLRDRDELKKIAKDYPDLEVDVRKRIAQLDYEDRLAAAQGRVAASNDRDELRKIGNDYPSLKPGTDARIAQLDYKDRMAEAQTRIAASNDLADLKNIGDQFPELKREADARILQLKNASWQELSAPARRIVQTSDRAELKKIEADYPALKGAVDARIARLDYEEQLGAQEKRIAASSNRDELKKIASDYPDLKVEVDARIAQLDREQRLADARRSIAVSNDRAQLKKIAGELPELKDEVDKRIAALDYADKVNAAQKRIAVSNDPDEINRIAADFPNLKAQAEARIVQIYEDRLTFAQKRIPVSNNQNELQKIAIDFPSLKAAVDARLLALEPPNRSIVDENRVIGYVVFGLIDVDNTLNPTYFSIDGTDKIRLPSRGDVISCTCSAQPFSIRGVPFHWDNVTKNYVGPSNPPVALLKRGDKLRVSGDVYITNDPNRRDGKLYAIAPVSEVIGKLIAPPKDVFTRPLSQPGVLGYVYVGQTGDDMSLLTSELFKNESRRGAIYPAPNDVLILTATTQVNLHIAAKHWNPNKNSYEIPPNVPNVVVKQGGTIKIGGDVLMSTGGHSIWAPVSEIKSQ